MMGLIMVWRVREQDGHTERVKCTWAWVCVSARLWGHVCAQAWVSKWLLKEQIPKASYGFQSPQRFPWTQKVPAFLREILVDPQDITCILHFSEEKTLHPLLMLMTVTLTQCHSLQHSWSQDFWTSQHPAFQVLQGRLTALPTTPPKISSSPASALASFSHCLGQ